jgi:AhpD family alkylhydroperoxidase
VFFLFLIFASSRSLRASVPLTRCRAASAYSRIEPTLGISTVGGIIKTETATKPHTHNGFWLERAWPEGAGAFNALRAKAFGAGKVDAKTKALIQLACVSLLRCKHCVNGTLTKLKKEHKATDQEIAEVMMVASFAAAGTNMAWAAEVFEDHVGHN